MENLETINQRIARNLAYYRKAANLTQAELAQKINYSDKSVSKWESGNGVPDIYILLKLAEMYGVTVDDLVGERKTPVKKEAPKMAKPMIMLLSSGLVWLVATVIFVVMNIFFPERNIWWLAFLYAVPVNAIVVVALAFSWKLKLTGFIGVSVLIWGFLACLYTTSRIVMGILGHTDYSSLWLLFLLGIPLQILEVLWVFFRWTLWRSNAPKTGADSWRNPPAAGAAAAGGREKSAPKTNRQSKNSSSARRYARKEERTDKPGNGEGDL